MRLIENHIDIWPSITIDCSTQV